MIINKKRLMMSLTAVFAATEVLLFILVHIARVDYDYSLRYGSIIAATVFAWLTLAIELLMAKSEFKDPRKILLNTTGGNFIRIAMIFTLIADYFMVAMEEANNLAGVTVFLGTQLFIFLHIFVNEAKKKVRIVNIAVRLSLMVILVVAVCLILGESTDPMSIISVIYYANLCTNAIFAHRLKSGGILLTVGLILFALCDINVGLTALDTIYGGFEEGTFLYNLMNTDIDLIWLFYIPSQTLIPMTPVLSNYKKSKA